MYISYAYLVITLLFFPWAGRYDGGHAIVHVQLLMEAQVKRLVPKHPPWIQAHAAAAVEPGLSSLMCTEHKEFWVGVSKFLDCIHLSTSMTCRKRHDWSCNGQWRYRPRWGRFGYIGVCDYKLGRRPGLILYASYFSAHILGYGCCVICCDFPWVEKVSCKAGGHIISRIHHLDGSHLDTDSACPARFSPGGTCLTAL